MRIAYGPLGLGTPDDWPVYQCETLAPEFEVVPFSGRMIPDADVLIHHSPEYAQERGLDGVAGFPGYRVAFLGDWHITVDHDAWTVRTKDGSMAAHFEHTVLVTSHGSEVLT